MARHCRSNTALLHKLMHSEQESQLSLTDHMSADALGARDLEQP